MDKPDAPQTPDPNAVSQGQYKSNVNTAIANSVMGNADVYGPMGSSTFTQTGSQKINGVNVPKYRQDVSLSPELQSLYDTYVGNQQSIGNIAGTQLGNVADTLGQPLNFDNASAMPTADRSYYESALMDRLNPQLDRDRAALDTRLANQGIMPGSEAYREAIALSDRGRNDARQQAVLGAGTYADQEFNRGLSARQQGIHEQMALRQTPINEINSLMNGSQATLPQFSGFQGGQVSPVDYSGNVWNAYNGQQQAYGQEMNQYNAMLGGIGGLMGTAMKIPFMGGLGA